MTNKDIRVFSIGSQTRSFCYISDLINGILKLIVSNILEPVNIGNPSEITIKQLAEEVISLAKSKSIIVYKPLPVDDPKIQQPNISKAKSDLGCEPTIDREEGLLKTIGYFKERLIKKGSRL